MSTSLPIIEGMVLKPEFYDIYAEFLSRYEGEGCTCFICPPCGFCTHEGNPSNLEETPEAWESELVAAVRDVAAMPNT